MNARRVALLTLALLTPLATAQETLTYIDLIHRLTDLERLATLASPGEACAQCSSYDRASKHDAATGKYVAWDANGDGSGFIREEDGSILMAEMTGPGCIWRVWSARPEDGHVRIYLDGAADPAVDLPFKAYFDGSTAPFNRKAMCYEAARGWNCYVPIPYQESCKIVAAPGWGRYYHWTYATFPQGAHVPAFHMDLTPEESAALDAADQFLGARLGTDPAGPRTREAVVRKTVAVGAGAAQTVAALEGPRAITGLRAKLDLPESPADRAVLRELVLRITWDGDAEPSVWTPLGDFFGTAPGANVYRSLPLGLTEDGWWYCYWYMPFAEKALVELANEGAEAREATFEIVHAPLTAPVDTLGRFHAKWHGDALLPEAPERQIDWTMVKTEGAGRFCGVMLHVWNPRGGWWGEGDEKLFVDNEPFPSTFGTGSEDYFGYAWGNPTLFARPYHNQTISSGNAGHVSVNRWHITDNVPFQTAFEGCIEKYFPNNRPTLFDCTAYWYLAPGGRDPYGPLPADQRMAWPEPDVKRVKGTIEGEKMEILAKTAGNPHPQELTGLGDQWSANTHLWWTGAQPGDKLDLALPVKEDGTFRIAAQLTKARDYAIVQLYLDDEKLGDPIDLFNPGVIPTGEMDLATRALKKGTSKFTLEIVGANPDAVKSYMAGVDYLKLVPAQQ